jgi:DNA-binding CsgD family transcriptional regulator
MDMKTYAVDWLDNTEDPIDLRLKRADALNDQLVRRAEWLDAPDKAIVLAMFDEGYSAAEIARLGNLPVRMVRTRIHRLVNRLGDPKVAYVARFCGSWSKTRASIGRSVFLHGKSLRETANELSMSFYLVRRHRESIDAMYEADKNVARKIAKNSIQSRQWR